MSDKIFMKANGEIRKWNGIADSQFSTSTFDSILVTDGALLSSMRFHRNSFNQLLMVNVFDAGGIDSTLQVYDPIQDKFLEGLLMSSSGSGPNGRLPFLFGQGKEVVSVVNGIWGNNRSPGSVKVGLSRFRKKYKNLKAALDDLS